MAVNYSIWNLNFCNQTFHFDRKLPNTFFFVLRDKTLHFNIYLTLPLIFLDSERSDECIDFTMMCVFFFVFVSVYSITSRNNAPISNFRGGFWRKSEYPWCNIQVKSKHFLTVFKKIEKNKKKMTEKREFLRKTSFRPNRFFLWL